MSASQCLETGLRPTLARNGMVIWVGALLLAVVAGCNQPVGTAPAQISDPQEMTLVQLNGGFGLLFITATAGNELRVFNPSDSGVPGVAPAQNFARGPNPLEPLSIPVVDQPFSLVKDVAYPNGAEVD